ncbi:YqiA/YcfP family alpha/beta fold hydrolase [Candidatus Albibeggiatoa sp. nov. NOAA]|uniref:YqiA/YcfP family alpha/beta fold hydrolase n=1 Tax=Candidatus Albibeggiatoa sp. nov. NOAA TaxID=3162724 RepID=UPI0032F104A0|nr:alpha/beta fold hydrolase [Thiotrichaceae bacterium]
MTYIYLHGWASDPNSSKAIFFQEQFARYGISLHIPDLNQNDFYHMTLTRQINQVAALFPDNGEPVTLIGSSLGGLISLWLAQKYSQVERLILMAPALEFYPNCKEVWGKDTFERWQKEGEVSMMHYAWEREELISFDFIRDAMQYQDKDLQRQLPTLILHGENDDVVPIQASRNFIAQRDWVDFKPFNSDHSLKDVLPEMWAATQDFCGLN